MKYIDFITRIALQYKFFRTKNLDISAAEASVVRFIGKFEGVSQDKITRSMRTNKSNIARLLKSLENKDYLYRVVDKEDRRNLIVYLTDKAKKSLKYIWKIDGEWIEYLRSGLTKEEVEIIEKLLEKVYEKATEWERHPFTEIFYDETEINLSNKESKD